MRALCCLYFVVIVGCGKTSPQAKPSAAAADAAPTTAPSSLGACRRALEALPSALPSARLAQFQAGCGAFAQPGPACTSPCELPVTLAPLVSPVWVAIHDVANGLRGKALPEERVLQKAWFPLPLARAWPGRYQLAVATATAAAPIEAITYVLAQADTRTGGVLPRAEVAPAGGARVRIGADFPGQEPDRPLEEYLNAVLVRDDDAPPAAAPTLVIADATLSAQRVLKVIQELPTEGARLAVATAADEQARAHRVRLTVTEIIDAPTGAARLLIGNDGYRVQLAADALVRLPRKGEAWDGAGLTDALRSVPGFDTGRVPLLLLIDGTATTADLVVALDAVAAAGGASVTVMKTRF